MKHTSRKLWAAGILVAVILGGLFILFAVAGPAFSSARLLTLLAAATPMPAPGEPIPLKPVAGLKSLNATGELQVNGLIDGERTRGSLDVDLTTNDQGKSRIHISGPLLGQLAAQVGGSLVGLFTPSSVDIYRVPGGSYVVVNGLFPLCIKPQESKATAALEELSPQSLLGMLTNSEAARGELLGQEKVNGKAVDRYRIDGEAFLAAAQNSRDPKLKAFSEALWSAEDAGLYVDPASGLPLAYLGGFSGAYAPLGFEGDFDVQIELTGVNQNTPVELPKACERPISP